MSYLLNNMNHIVNFGSYMLLTLEVIVFNYLGPRKYFIFPFCLINNLARIYLEKRSSVKLQIRKVMFPNILNKHIVVYIKIDWSIKKSNFQYTYHISDSAEIKINKLWFLVHFSHLWIKFISSKRQTTRKI